MTTTVSGQFGKYTQVGKIGEGGFGEVYRAMDVELGRPVAIKVPHQELLKDPAFVNQFRQEARLAAQLDHPNIVRIYSIGELADGTPYLEMELVEGQTLADLIKEKRRLTPAEALTVLELVCAALQEAHGRGIVHRDLKPQNILIRKSDGRVLVSDFGLAKATESSFQASLSSSNVVVGTFRYMPPEQANRQLGEPGPQSDLYSLGCILYEMLTGRVPFESSSVGQLVYEHATQMPEPPSNINIGLSRAVESVVLKAMQKKPADRFASASAMARAMAAAKQDKVVAGVYPEKPSGAANAPAPASPTSEKRRGGLTWVLLSIVALAVAAAIIVGPRLFGNDQPTPNPPLAAQAPTATPDATATAAIEETRVQRAVNATRTAEAANASTDTRLPTDTATPDTTATAAADATRIRIAIDATSTAEALRRPTPTPSPSSTSTPTRTPTATSTPRPTATPNMRATQTAEAQKIQAAVQATRRAEAATQTTVAPPRPQSTSSLAASTRAGTSSGAVGTPVAIATVESQHPYANASNESWFISNDSGLNAMQIHFSRIELEEGVDRIEIRNAEEVLLQEIASSYPDGLWTEIIPSAGAYIMLKSDSADTAWGFLVDQIAPVDYPSLAHSPHPYPNRSDASITLVNNALNPPGTQVHFDRLDLEDNVDYVIISDIDGNPYQWITGSYPQGLTSKAVPGSGIKVSLLSDGSIQRWGYNIDAVLSAQAAQPDDPPTRATDLAASDHPYSHDFDKTWTITNPDVAATSSKVHFSRIETEACCDFIQLLDSAGTVIQTIAGRYDDLWSDYIPGRIVKVRFRSNGCCSNGWGFRIDAITGSVASPGLAQSDHPYGHDLRGAWTLTNPNVSAVSSKIHFQLINTEECCDFIQILDAKDTVIQTLSGNRQDLWSDYVPGRIVKLRFLSNGCCSNGWGFRVDAIVNSVPNPGLAQSDHPYGHDLNKLWTVTNPDPGASSSRVHFSRIETEQCCDIIELLDSQDTVVQALSGRQADVWSDYVPGRVVKIRFRTNGCCSNGWGFRVDEIESK